jgi:hypothetical protein
MSIKIEAMPQLIPQGELDRSFVEKKRIEAVQALKRGHRISTSLLFMGATLYHYQKTNTTGTFFTADPDGSINFLYAYKSIPLEGKPRAAEALAYRFNNRGKGIIGEVFAKHLLPHCKFVVTDYAYTPLGQDWFDTQYDHAFARGLKVYAIDLKAETIKQVDAQTFLELQPLYWGLDDAHQKYRFAIEI